MPHVNGKSGWWATVDDGTSWRRFGGLRGVEVVLQLLQLLLLLRRHAGHTGLEPRAQLRAHVAQVLPQLPRVRASAYS